MQPEDYPASPNAPNQTADGVFISWSGDRSRRIGEALKLWLLRLFPRVDFWISTQDLAPGAPWREELDKQLLQRKIGILCLTPGNTKNPWLVHEATRLRKDDQRVVMPYCFEVPLQRLSNNPLDQLQAFSADKQGTLRLVREINKNMTVQHPPYMLESAFEVWWKEFVSELEAAAWRDDFNSFFGPADAEGRYPAVFLDASLENPQVSEKRRMTKTQESNAELCALRVRKWPPKAERARPKGIRQIVPYQELEVVLMLDREFRKYNRKIELKLDEYHPDEKRPLPPCSCLSLGLGFNNLTLRLGEMSRVYTVRYDEPVDSTKFTTDHFILTDYGTKKMPIKGKVIVPKNQVEADEEWALIARVLVSETDHSAPIPFLVCAGHTADGTMVACRFLAQRWRTEIWDENRELLKDHHMACILAHHKYPGAPDPRLLTTKAFRYAGVRGELRRRKV